MQRRLVEVLTDKNMKVGYHSVLWDGSRYSSGIYFVKMQAGSVQGYVNTRKLMLVK